MKLISYSVLSCTLLFMTCHLRAQQQYSIPANDDYRLVWSDEFNSDGPVNSAVWNHEEGFQRNHELQWYASECAYQKDGLLMLEARPVDLPNPLYKDGSNDWRSSRKRIECISASITTQGKYEFQYGRVEVRARIPVGKGAWPAIWTLGSSMEWPSCGEIDIMEFYRIQGVPHIMANTAHGTDKHWDAKWHSVATPFSHFLEKNADWASEFHIWRMDWTERYIRLYLDDELLNEVSLDATVNGNIGRGTNAFKHPHYILLNLAVGGDNGGPVSADAYPMRYEVDYVRVYQQK